MKKNIGRQLPVYGYAVNTLEGLMYIGKSRSLDCKTVIEVRPEGWPSLPDNTPVVRATGYDQINTEIGYTYRDEYHRYKQWCKDLGI